MVARCATAVSFCCKGLINVINKVKMQEKIQRKNLKFLGFDICPKNVSRGRRHCTQMVFSTCTSKLSPNFTY